MQPHREKEQPFLLELITPENSYTPENNSKEFTSLLVGPFQSLIFFFFMLFFLKRIMHGVIDAVVIDLS